MKKMVHPNIVNIFEGFFVDNREIWLIMEYMDGAALRDIIKETHIEENQIAEICLKASW